MGFDKVGMANLALAKLGAKRISSFGDDSDEARVISDVYDYIRDEFLSEAPWGFSLKRVLLQLLADTPAFTTDGMTSVYARPNDLIRVFWTSDATATVRLEQNGILSDTANLGIIYVFRNDDPSTYYSMARTAMATRLAAEIGFNLSESAKKAQALYEEYEKIRLPRAISSDSQQSTPMQAVQFEWESARFVGGNAFVVQPGQQTWHPFF